MKQTRVALITRWQQIDGDYEYARNLIEYLHTAQPDIQITPFPVQRGVEDLLSAVRDYDVVHFNFVFGFPITEPGTISRFGSKRVVLTFHENNPGDSKGTHAFLRECAVVVAHERNPHGFAFIPHGIPVMEPCVWSKENKTIGTAGFPFPDKRIPEIAQATKLLTNMTPRICGCTIIACDSGHANTWWTKQQVLNSFPLAEYVTDYLQQPQLLNLLARNLVNVFVPNSRRLGPSGSVRLGLATGSHIVLSRSAMFRDLEEYPNEIEWVDGTSEDVTPQKIADACLRVIENGKRPRRVLEDGSWTKAAKLYADIYRSVA